MAEITCNFNSFVDSFYMILYFDSQNSQLLSKLRTMPALGVGDVIFFQQINILGVLSKKIISQS